MLHRKAHASFGPKRVKSSPADHVIYAAEDLQKADRIAAAPRKEKVCHGTKSLPR